MRTNKEIQKKIKELTPEFELAEESYFSAVNAKMMRQGLYSPIDFKVLESEYEILKKEIDTLYWVLNKDK